MADDDSDFQQRFKGAVDEFTGQPIPDPTGEYGGTKTKPADIKPTGRVTIPTEPGITKAPETAGTTDPVPAYTGTPEEQANQHLQDLIKQEQQDRAAESANNVKLFQQIQQDYEDEVKNRPQMPQLPQEQPMPQADQRQYGKDLLGYFAIALPLAALMGARGGAFAAGAWGGFGLGLKALVQGENEKADQRISRAQAVNQAADKQYMRQMERYKEIWGNQTYDLAQKQKLVESVSRLYGDKTLADEAAIQDWGRTQAALQKREDALRKKNEDEEKRNNAFTTPKDWPKYAQAFFDKYHWFPRPSSMTDRLLDPAKRKQLESFTYTMWADQQKAEQQKAKKKPDEEEPKTKAEKAVEEGASLFDGIGSTEQP